MISSFDNFIGSFTMLHFDIFRKVKFGDFMMLILDFVDFVGENSSQISCRGYAKHRNCPIPHLGFRQLQLR